MNTSNRRFAALMVAMVVAFVALVAARPVQAQITVDNSSGCTLLLTLLDAGGNQAGPYTITSGSTPTSITLPGGFVATSVEDFDGRRRNFTGSPAPGCTGCIPVATSGAGGSCCVNVCYDSAAAKITITACGPC